MAPTLRNRTTRVVAGLAIAALVVAGCGDDDEDAGGSSATTAAPDTEETTTTAGDEGGDEGGDNAELCALAEEMFNQDDFPSAEQIQQYQELAPPELAEATEVAGAPFIELQDDPVALLNALAEDDVEAAVYEIDAFELEECGIDHETAEVAARPDEPEEGANVVDVVATDYSFAIPEVSAGRTSFVMTNEGAETHFLFVTRLLDGTTLDEALAFEGDVEEAGLAEDLGDSGLAAPGGDDVEVLTVDLEPGDYGMLCFISGPDGTPHAFMGMAIPFTVA